MDPDRSAQTRAVVPRAGVAQKSLLDAVEVGGQVGWRTLAGQPAEQVADGVQRLLQRLVCGAVGAAGDLGGDHVQAVGVGEGGGLGLGGWW
jgi:hypothetical protein